MPFYTHAHGCRDRRNLAVALKDTRSVIGTLQTVLGIIIHIFFFFMYLLVLQASPQSRLSYVQSCLGRCIIIHIFLLFVFLLVVHAKLYANIF